jgi:ferritin-like metal-binding protein YciE
MRSTMRAVLITLAGTKTVDNATDAQTTCMTGFSPARAGLSRIEALDLSKAYAAESEEDEAQTPIPKDGTPRPPSPFHAADTRAGRLAKEAKMGLFTADIKTLDDLFVHTLQDIYYAENQILKAMPKMISKATDPQLKQGFEMHLRETENQIKRLEQVFQMHGHKPKGVDCPAIDGIIKEANTTAGEIGDKDVLDAALLASAQAVEHYEITRYGTLIAWAKQLGRSDCAAVLQQNLDEEYATDKKLTAMAESKVNRKAA